MAKKYLTTDQNDTKHEIGVVGKETVLLDGKPMRVTVLSPGRYAFKDDANSYEAVVVKREESWARIFMNGQLVDVQIESEGMQLIKALELDKVKKKTIKNLKAPMPGMVLNVLVKEGDSVSKGDGLLVLEAMKMENLIKAPGDATVTSIGVNEGQAVEKGQLLIKFN